MTRREFSLYAAERHITDRAISLGVWVVRAYVLTRYALRRKR